MVWYFLYIYFLLSKFQWLLLSKQEYMFRRTRIEKAILGLCNGRDYEGGKHMIRSF